MTPHNPENLIGFRAGARQPKHYISLGENKMLKCYKTEQSLQVERSGYLANLRVGKKSEICFVSGDNDIYTIEELINNFGYDAKTLINQRIVFSIENEI